VGRGRKAPSPPIEIRRVELWREPVPTLRIHTSRPVRPAIASVPADGRSPARLVIDVPAPATARATRSIGGFGVVRRVTVASHGKGGTQIVVDLAEPCPHRIRLDGRLAAIELAAPNAAVTPAAAPDATSAGSMPQLAVMTTENAPAAAEPEVAPTASFATAPEPVLTIERGARFAWPDLDAPYYRDANAAAERVALKAWRQGTPTLDQLTRHDGAAALYLAADVTYLRTLLGRDEPLAGPLAYERALREAPTFPDAPRALLMLGLANLRCGLAPEADMAFARLQHEHPESAYVPAATLWRATALRQRHRLDDARTALAPLLARTPPTLRCDVLVEQAEIARGESQPAEAMRLDEQLARECPRQAELASMIEARAATLLAAGRRPDARALLAAPAAALPIDDQARLLVHAADLAREDGDLEGARQALDRVLGLHVSAAMRVIAQAHSARLDAFVSPDRAVTALEALAAGAPTPAVHAEVLAQIAETLADAGRFEDALARLDRSDEIDSAARRQLVEHHDAILARWIGAQAAAGDPVGIATVYASHRTAIDTRASRATTLQVAGALGAVGLPAAALRVLRLRQPPDDPEFSLTLGEAGLAAGQAAAARDVLERIGPGGLAADVAARRARLAERVAIADGALDGVTVPDDPAAVRELAAAWLGRGDAALARSGWDEARAAYGRARAVATARDQATAASAGIVAASAGAGGGVTPVVDDLAAIDEPLVRRGVALLAATRPFGGSPAPGPAGETPHAR
jgi:tetratricopeptide (TPR) repeat protein